MESNIRFAGAATATCNPGTAITPEISFGKMGKGTFKVGRLFIDYRSGGAGSHEAFLTELKIAGDPQLEGYVPAQVFHPEFDLSPQFNVECGTSNTINIRMDSDAANVLKICAGRADTGPRRERPLAVAGQTTAPAALAAGASIDLLINPQESGGLAARLVAVDLDALDESLVIESIKYNNVEFVVGEPIPFAAFGPLAKSVPWLDIPSWQGGVDKLYVRVKNEHGATAAKPCVAIVFA